MVRPSGSPEHKHLAVWFASAFVTRDASLQTSVGRSGKNSIYEIFSTCFPQATRELNNRTGLSNCEMNKALEHAGFVRQRNRMIPDGEQRHTYRFAECRWFDPDESNEIRIIEQAWQSLCRLRIPQIPLPKFLQIIRQAREADDEFVIPGKPNAFNAKSKRNCFSMTTSRTSSPASSQNTSCTVASGVTSDETTSSFGETEESFKLFTSTQEVCATETSNWYPTNESYGKEGLQSATPSLQSANAFQGQAPVNCNTTNPLKQHTHPLLSCSPSQQCSDVCENAQWSNFNSAAWSPGHGQSGLHKHVTYYQNSSLSSDVMNSDPFVLDGDLGCPDLPDRELQHLLLMLRARV